MKKQSIGLTLIEVILGMTIVGVISLMTIPQFVVAAEEAKAQAKWDVSVAAKDSQVMLSTRTGESPSVLNLADNLANFGGKAVAGGILVQVDGEDYTIPTYNNAMCNEPTQDVTEKVRCVGSIS